MTIPTRSSSLPAACWPRRSPLPRATLRAAASRSPTPRPPPRPTSHRARRTSSTCSTPAATRARSMSPAFPRCGTSRTIPVFAPLSGHRLRLRRGVEADARRATRGATCTIPALSQTDGDYDGRWLFVNDNANNRVARIDLRDFKTKQILGPIPNSMRQSRLVVRHREQRSTSLVATRFSVPLPKGRYADPANYETEFNGMVSGLKVDPGDGHAVGRLAGADAALQLGSRIDRQGARAPAGRSGRPTTPRWRPTRSKANSTRLDRDYAAIVNWRAAEQAVADGKADDDGRRAGARSGEGARRDVLAAGAEVAARHRHRSVRPLDRGVAASSQPVSSVFDFKKIKCGDRRASSSTRKSAASRC